MAVQFKKFHDDILAGLGTFRVILAFIVILDLVRRLHSGLTFLVDDGPLPVAALRASLMAHGDPLLSLHALSGRTEFVVALLCVQIVLMVLFAAGVYRTATGWTSWLLLASLQQRNELILHGADSLVCISLLWTNLVDLERKLGATRRWNFSALLFFAHIVLVFFSSGLSKLSSIWISGEALQVLVSYETTVRVFARPLLEYPGVLKVLTYVTLTLEAGSIFWFALFTLNRTFRRGFTVALILFHLGIFALMKVGNFSLISIPLWCLFGGLLARPLPAAVSLPMDRRGLTALRTLSTFVFLLALSSFMVVGLGLPEFRPEAWKSFSRLARISRTWHLYSLNHPEIARMDVFIEENGHPVRSPITGANWPTARPHPLGEKNSDLRWMHFLYNLRRNRPPEVDFHFGKFLCRTFPEEKCFPYAANITI